MATLRNFTYVLDVGFETILDTLTVAVTSTPISGLIGMFIAFLVVRKRFLGRSAMEFTSMLSCLARYSNWYWVHLGV